MKTIKIIILLLSLYLIACNSHKTKNNLSIENLKGHVKSIKENTFTAVVRLGAIVKDKTQSPIKLWKYNESGNTTEVNFLNQDSTIFYTTNFTHNEKGNVIEGKDGYSKSESYHYDLNGNIDEIIYYKTDSTIRSKSTMRFDKKGNQIEEFHFGADGNLSEKLINKFDEKGSNIEMLVYSPDGSFNSRYTFKYDAQKNKTEEIGYDTDGSILKKSVFKYENFDKAGNWLMQTTILDGKPISIIEREFEYYQ